MQNHRDKYTSACNLLRILKSVIARPPTRLTPRTETCVVYFIAKTKRVTVLAPRTRSNDFKAYPLVFD